MEGRNRSEEHDTVSSDTNLDVNRSGMYTYTIESCKYKEMKLKFLMNLIITLTTC